MIHSYLGNINIPFSERCKICYKWKQMVVVKIRRIRINFFFLFFITTNFLLFMNFYSLYGQPNQLVKPIKLLCEYIHTKKNVTDFGDILFSVNVARFEERLCLRKASLALSKKQKIIGYNVIIVLIWLKLPF